MNRMTVFLRAMLVIPLLSASVAADGPKKPRRPTPRSTANQAIKNVQKDIKETEKDLKEAQEDLKKAARDLVGAQASYKQATKEVEKAHDSLQERLGPKVGLPEAIGALERAEAEYERAVKGLIAKLADDATFQQLKQAMDEADEAVDALRKDGTSSDARKDRLAQASKDALKARQAYHDRIDHDPAVKPFKDKVMQADSRLKEVRKKLNQEIKDDAPLNAAQSTFKQAKRELERATSASAAAENKVSNLQQRLAVDHAKLGR